MDHKNLTIFITTKVLNQQQVRWLEELSLYYFKISYWKELENAAIDTLSQRSDYFIEKEEVSYTILREIKNGRLYYNNIILSATF